jgi:hypothetical protein
MKALTLLVLPCLVLFQLPVENPNWKFHAEPAPEWNERFASKSGWIGGDGAYSVALKGNRIVWLFSDTWIGKIQDGKRIDATIVNNTVAMQRGRDASSPVEFIIRQDANKKATAFVVPKNGPGWYWLFSAARIGDRLLMFLPRIEKTRDPGVFGFRQTGLALGIVENPDDEPKLWRIEQRTVPFVVTTPERNLTWGMATVSTDEYVYFFGTDEIRGKNQVRHLILARAPLDHATHLASWRFYQDGQWIEDFHQCSHLADHVGSEGSVSYLPILRQYGLVYTHNGLSDRIMMRTAAQPWGPWSAPTVLYTCPEMKADKNLFSYAAKAHPALAENDELIISYVVNSFDFWQVARDARLYWPKFVRVKFTAAP